jgi:hypothetical protein
MQRSCLTNSDDIDPRAKKLTNSSSKPILSLLTSRETKSKCTLQKSLSVWVLSWLVLKWFDELTNHKGVIRPWSFSSFYVSQLVESKMKVCKMLRHQNGSKLLQSFSQKKGPTYSNTIMLYLKIRKKFEKDQLIDLKLHTTTWPSNTMHPQHVVLQQIEQNKPDLRR